MTSLATPRFAAGRLKATFLRYAMVCLLARSPTFMNDRKPPPDEHETRGAVALTIAWMLTCLSTAVAVLLVMALRLLAIAFPVAAGGVHPLAKVAGVFLFVAVLTGGLCLLFTPLTLLARRQPPPRPITIAAVLIGAAPILLLAILSLL
jgi:hypothetical protein